MKINEIAGGKKNFQLHQKVAKLRKKFAKIFFDRSQKNASIGVLMTSFCSVTENNELWSIVRSLDGLLTL